MYFVCPIRAATPVSSLETRMAQYKDLDRKAIQLAKQIVKMCTEAGSGHPSSALSILHITMALMYRVMKYDPKNPADSIVLAEQWSGLRAR